MPPTLRTASSDVAMNSGSVLTTRGKAVSTSTTSQSLMA